MHRNAAKLNDVWSYIGDGTREPPRGWTHIAEQEQFGTWIIAPRMHPELEEGFVPGSSQFFAVIPGGAELKISPVPDKVGI